jgi:hypothetical protein
VGINAKVILCNIVNPTTDGPEGSEPAPLKTPMEKMKIVK